MNKILRLISTSILIVLINTGCSSQNDNKSAIDDKPAMELYAEAKTELDAGNFLQASEILEAIDNRYPFGPHSNQVELDLIYSYYKLDETALALANIDRFIRLNPTHPDLDYVYYIKALTNMAADESFFQDLFGMDRFDRDPSYAQQTFKDLSHIIRYYPKSQYAVDAKQRLIFIKDRLARYEISIGEWYIKREAYIAAINRGKAVLNNYPDTKSTEQALELIIKGYTKLDLQEPKENALAVLKLNFPNNRLVD